MNFLDTKLVRRWCVAQHRLQLGMQYGSSRVEEALARFLPAATG